MKPGDESKDIRIINYICSELKYTEIGTLIRTQNGTSKDPGGFDA